MLRVLLCLLGLLAASVEAQAMRRGGASPLRVVLIPADGGTESGTRADYQPVFNAIGRSTGLSFDLKVAQSYGAVVEALCGGTADVAFVGPVTFVQASRRRCAELLAVGVKDGKSSYYAGIFAKRSSGIGSIAQLRGKRVAFGDINSASSFIFPMAMIVEAKLDPLKALAAARLTGSHVNSIAALEQGRVDAAALSFDSFDKAVRQKVIDPRSYRVVARSMPIPYPPLVVSTRLPAATKATLRAAFASVATAPGVTPDMIRGYGGERIDGYDTRYQARNFTLAAAKRALIDDDLKGHLLRRSSGRR
jgi:phosphonate transport system substrate-binding protein